MIHDAISVEEYQGLFGRARNCLVNIIDFVHNHYRQEPTIRLRTIYRQPDDYSCGAASLKTLMEHCGEQADLDYLIELCKTTKNGTPITNLVIAAEKFGFRAVVKRYANVDDLKSNLREGRIPLVGYLVLDEDVPEPHYSLVLEVTDKQVLMADSRTGSTYTLRIDEFLKSWGEDNPPWTMMTISR